MNKEQRRKYAKKYRENHKDKIREYQKKYWAEHGEEINAKRRNRKCYKTRCKRAIEYIEKHTDKLQTIIVPKIEFNYNDLLNILKGDKDGSNK